VAFIPSHQELARHPKTRKAARLLGVPLPTMLGYLHLLWYWAMDYAKDGDLSRYDPEDFAEGAQWEGDPACFVAALINCGVGDLPGFLECTADGGLHLHHWHEYGGKLHEEREAAARRMRAGRHDAAAVAPTVAAPTVAADAFPLPTADCRPPTALPPYLHTAAPPAITAIVRECSRTFAARSPREERRSDEMTRDDTIQEESERERERDCAPTPAPAHEHERVHDRDRDRDRIYALPSLVPARLPPSPTAQDASVQGQGQGEAAYVPVPSPVSVSSPSPSPSLSRSFCPTNAVLPPARLSADAAAVGTTPETLAHILPQWADARLSAGKRAADWYADFRKFARSYLEHERHDHAHDPRRQRDAPGAPGSRAAPTAAAITRAPSTDKYTLTAVASSLNALDRLMGKEP